MGWVNNPNYSQNVFHRTGAETATGNKTFSGNVSFTGTATAVTQATSDSSTKLATTAFVNNAMSSYASLPSGVILPFGGSSAPTGFLICDGSAVSRTDYADLFDVIGTTYGSGDGSTTFNLPNLSSGVLPSSSTVDVVGNGNALGIVDDISTEAKQHNALVVGSGSSSFTSAKVPFSAFNLNAPLAIGSTGTALEFGTNNKALGVSTLPEWSGLTGSITGVSVNYIIKV
ncbi:MAG: tail fiber protein [Alphaproteobacteria bacterium]|nr:tail fiber protein [Alphaproteobacteria bacterium]